MLAAIVLLVCGCAGGPSAPTREIDISTGGTNSGYGLTVVLTGTPNSAGVLTDVTMTFTAKKVMTVSVDLWLNGDQGDPDIRGNYQGAYDADYGTINVQPGISTRHIYPQNYGWTTATGAGPHVYNSLTSVTVTVVQQ